MKKKHILVASFLALFTWFAIRPKNVNAFGNNTSLRLIGDSQTKRHLGKAYVDVFDTFEVSYFGKEGVSFTDYVNNDDLFEQAFSQCSNILIIQIGDNGIPNRSQAFETFINKIKTKCPKSKIIFGGPMKAVSPTIKSNFVNTSNPQSVRYLPNYNRIRRMWNERLQTWLKRHNIPFFDNYRIQESQPLSSTFSDSRKGDGVHLTKESAKEQAVLMHNFIYDLFEKV